MESLKRLRGWRFWPAVVVMVALVVVAVAAMLASSYDNDRAVIYVEILKIMLAWPVLAFTLLMIMVLLFHKELATLIGRTEKVEGRGMSAHFRLEQPDIPDGDRPIELPKTTVTIDRQISWNVEAPAPPPDTEAKKEIIATLHHEIEELRGEAERWWHRYLTAFFSPTTLSVFRAIPWLAAIMDYEERPGAVPEVRLLLGDGGVVPVTREEFEQAIKALLGYELIRRQDLEKWELTDKGREFMAFLDSEDGRALQGELWESRHIIRFRRDRELGKY